MRKRGEKRGGKEEKKGSPTRKIILRHFRARKTKKRGERTGKSRKEREERRQEGSSPPFFLHAIPPPPRGNSIAEGRKGRVFEKKRERSGPFFFWFPLLTSSTRKYKKKKKKREGSKLAFSSASHRYLPREAQSVQQREKGRRGGEGEPACPSASVLGLIVTSSPSSLSQSFRNERGRSHRVERGWGRMRLIVSTPADQRSDRSRSQKTKKHEKKEKRREKKKRSSSNHLSTLIYVSNLANL